MERKFSLAYLTIPGVDPFDQIRIAAEAGYDYVSLRTIPMGPENLRLVWKKTRSCLRISKKPLRTPA
jgi:hypothetical protein